MLNRKVVIILVASFILLITVGIFAKEDFMFKDVNNSKVIKQEDTISMMVEQTAGAGDYILETRTSWPTLSDGYKFNSTLSKCENGSNLSWDSTNGLVTMSGNVSDKCYVYFDLTSFLLSTTSSYETTSIYSRGLFLNGVSISDGIGKSFVYKVGDVLKYSNGSRCFNCAISIYDANSNLITNLSPSCDATEYVMTGNEVSVVSSYGGPSGGLCGGGFA